MYMICAHTINNRSGLSVHVIVHYGTVIKTHHIFFQTAVITIFIKYKKIYWISLIGESG